MISEPCGAHLIGDEAERVPRPRRFLESHGLRVEDPHRAVEGTHVAGAIQCRAYWR